MEETNQLQIITIFFSSNQIEQLSIQLFDNTDEQIETILLKNYTTHSLRLPKEKHSFYCIVSSQSHSIEEQFDCDFSQNQKDKDKMTIVKCFSQFKVKIDSEMVTEFQVITGENSPQSEQAALYKIAGENLKKLEGKIIKKMEMKELVKPILSKGKKNKFKSNPQGKAKTNFMVKDDEEEEKEIFGNKCPLRTEKKVATIKYFNQSAISEEEGENHHRSMTILIQRGLRHKTYMPKLCRDSEGQSSHKALPCDKQKKKESEPQYKRLLKTINGSSCIFNVKKRIPRKNHSSVVQQLEKETHQQLENQKKLIDLVHEAVASLKTTLSATTSPCCSQLRVKGVMSSTNSPLKPRKSGIARRRRVL